MNAAQYKEAIAAAAQYAKTSTRQPRDPCASFTSYLSGWLKFAGDHASHQILQDVIFPNGELASIDAADSVLKLDGDMSEIPNILRHQAGIE